jgi:3-hydroxyacyl-CoA dehydrogenase/3a,7a,12a-trihydroxy-5b-cholest-24-enoyl-CoA hydratase
MPVDLRVVGRPLESAPYAYDEQDVILYALGVGCGADELGFVYEQELKTLPTFAVVPMFPAFLTALGAGLQVNPMMVVHGEHRIELPRALPTRARVTTTPTIRAIYDKGSGALMVVDLDTVDAEGRLLFRNVFTAFARGEGGFGGERGPSGAKHVPPDRTPDAVATFRTLPQQALLYRLSGDRNPIHVDPRVAAAVGFARPILHGLCTFGYVGRAVMAAYAGGDPAHLRDLEVRFAGVVYPGETLVVEMWGEGDARIIVRARTEERGEPVITNAAATVA